MQNNPSTIPSAEPPDLKKNSDLILREKMALERTKMANYRTFLAFLRTSLYFPVAGITMHEALSLSYGKYLLWGGIIIGAAILTAGIIYYRLAVKRLKKYGASIGKALLSVED